MKDLPNYFFVINKGKEEQQDNDSQIDVSGDEGNKENIKNDDDETYNFNKNNYIKLSDYNQQLFSTFIETDEAYINDTDKKLLPKSKNYIGPFVIQTTFEIYKEGKIYKLRSIEENLEIEPKTIIINESKLSIPKIIKNYFFNTKYSKESLARALIFILYKLIRKIDYYSKLVEKEILKDSKDIKNYKFLLCLIFNNIPFEDIDEIVENDLKILIENGYIKHTF